MKGIIFNLLEEVVKREYGDDTWDALLEAGQLDGAYTSLGNYPDGELMKIVAAASTALKVPTDQLVRWFGRSALPILAMRYPHFFQPHKSTRSFLLTLNDIIHPEVLRLYPGAHVPIFTFDTSSNQVLLMAYKSSRGLCSLAEGFIEGAAIHYGEEAEYKQEKCSLRGNDQCLWRISFKKGLAL